MAAQLSLLGRGLLLGLLLGLVYDALRVLRRRWTGQALAAVLDGWFCLLCLWWLLGLTMTAGGGEVRLYWLVSAGAGTGLYLGFFSRWVRPLLVFWLDTAQSFVRLLLFPLRQAGRGIKKFVQKGKKLFYFGRKYSIMIIQPHPRRRHIRKEAGTMTRTGTKTKKRRSNPLLRIFLLCAILLLSFQIFRLQQQLASASAEQSALETQVMTQQQENDALLADLQRADDPAYLQDLARQELGFVTPGERVFYDVNP